MGGPPIVLYLMGRERRGGPRFARPSSRSSCRATCSDRASRWSRAHYRRRSASLRGRRSGSRRSACWRAPGFEAACPAGAISGLCAGGAHHYQHGRARVCAVLTADVRARVSLTMSGPCSPSASSPASTSRTAASSRASASWTCGTPATPSSWRGPTTRKAPTNWCFST